MTNKFWFNDKQETRFLNIDNKGFVPFVGKDLICARCHSKVEKPNHSWVGECKVCRNIVSFFCPTPIQTIAGVCEASIIFNIGGYGSGKTTISSHLLSTMIRRVSGSRTICLAQTIQQLERNAISELKTFFAPSEFKKMTKDYWEMTNGSIIEFWPSDDPDKLKSANANFIWIVEGNNHKMEAMFNEALARIRNDKGFVYAKNDKGEVIYEEVANGEIKPKIVDNMNFIIVEANPDDNSWTNNSVYKAHTIIHTPSVKGLDIIRQRAKPTRVFDDFTNKETNTDVVAILNATIDNPTLPNSYFINLHHRCRTQDEYDKIVYCDITSKEGLVFKDLVENPHKYIVDVQQVDMFKKDLVFVEGLDPAGSNVSNDPECYLLVMFDKQFKQLTVLDGHEIAGLNLQESTKRMWDIRHRWNWSREKHLTFVADNALGRSDKINKNHSLKNEYELRMLTSITLQNQKNIDYGIKLIKHWMEVGALKISKRVEFLIQEMMLYATYVQTKVYKNGEIRDVQVYSETANHAIDALRYIIVQLETMGYRQDAHMIDFNKASLNGYNGMDYMFRKKDDVRNFLPDFSKPLTTSTQKKVLKL